MKQLFLVLFLLSGLLITNQVSAINSEKIPATGGALVFTPQFTVNDFLSLDVKNYRTADGKKLKWTERLAFKVVQKNLARKVKKGKIDGDLAMEDAKAAGGNLYGLLSLIFSVVGLFVPYVGLALLVAAVVLGIIGINRDNNPTMAIIGLVISALALLLILIVIAVGFSFLWA